MEMFRLVPVDLPTSTLEPGGYVIRDSEGRSLCITLHHPMTRRDLAALVVRAGSSALPSITLSSAA